MSDITKFTKLVYLLDEMSDYGEFNDILEKFGVDELAEAIAIAIEKSEQGE